MEAPKVIEVPGIPMPLREMSLDEYMAALPNPHYARTELAEIRANALKSIEYANQLMVANAKVLELQRALLEAGDIIKDIPGIPPEIAAIAPEPSASPWPKVSCPTCNKLVSSSPGAWASHQKGKHNLSNVPVPELYKTS